MKTQSNTPKTNTLVINKCTIALTNIEKVLFPENKIKKKDLIAYYQQIAPHMVPLIKGRPLSLFRFPNGIHQEKFFQKNVPDFFPSWIDTVKVKHRQKKGYDYYCVCNNQQTLMYLANYVTVPHCWLSKEDKLDYPDRIIFDLDPGNPIDFRLVQKTAFALKQLLEMLGLTCFAMLTGSRGMHVVVPIKRTHTFDQTRDFARTVATIVAASDPKKITIDARQATRKNRLFIDYLRNGYGATSVAPYAVRDLAGAPVAAPISWDEAGEKTLHAQRYTIKTVIKKVEKADPWKNLSKSAGSFAKAQKIVEKLVASERRITKK